MHHTAPADLEPNSFSPPPRPVAWWRGKDSNLRRRKPADLQSAPVGRLGTPPRKRAAYSDFQGAGCQCVLARKLLADAPLRGTESLERGRRRLGRKRLPKGNAQAQGLWSDLGTSAVTFKSCADAPELRRWDLHALLPQRRQLLYPYADPAPHESPVRAWRKPREWPRSA